MHLLYSYQIKVATKRAHRERRERARERKRRGETERVACSHTHTHHTPTPHLTGRTPRPDRPKILQLAYFFIFLGLVNLNTHSSTKGRGTKKCRHGWATIAVMRTHGRLSRRPAKEQPPADMLDDKTSNTTADHTHIPLVL